MCAVSQLSRSFAKNLIRGNEVITSVKAYCDGSGKPNSSAWVVLAGVAAEDSVWAGFERGWKQVLDDRTPVAPYLHMNEIVSGSGPFIEENGWDEAKRSKLIWDALIYTQTLDKERFRTFMCCIDAATHRELKASRPDFPTVATMCNKYVPIQIFKWYLGKFSNWQTSDLYYFFDQNECFYGPFKSLVQRRQKRSRRGLYNHWDIIKEVRDVNMRANLPLQLADLLAWVQHRRLTPHREGLLWGDLHQVTDQVLPFTRKEIKSAELMHIERYLDAGSIVNNYFNDLTFKED